MKIVRQWSPSEDGLVYRVVTAERAEFLVAQGGVKSTDVMSPDEFFASLTPNMRANAFVVQPVRPL
jgi:hypothetical protein